MGSLDVSTMVRNDILTKKIPKREFRITSLCWHAFFIRLIIILLIFLLRNYIGTDFMTDVVYHDDVKYSDCGLIYSQTAKSLIDVDAFNSAALSVGYNARSTDMSFWFWFVSIATYITKSTWIIRIINAGFAAYTVKFIYQLAKNMCSDSCAKLSAKILAFLPYSCIFSCFIFKDQLIMLCIVYIVLQISKYRQNQRLKFLNILFTVICLAIFRYSRSGLAEVMLIVIAVSILINIFKTKNKNAKIVSAFLFIAGFILLFNHMDYIVNTLMEKYYAYVITGRYSNATIGIFGINSFTEFYKFPVAYLFALIQPFSLNITLDSWMSIVSYLNITLIPIAIGNLLYLFFTKKGDWYIYWVMLAIYFGAIILSLGIFRHYFFILPFSVINFSDYYNKNRHHILLWINSIFLLAALIVYYYFVK